MYVLYRCMSNLQTIIWRFFVVALKTRRSRRFALHFHVLVKLQKSPAMNLLQLCLFRIKNLHAQLFALSMELWFLAKKAYHILRWILEFVTYKLYWICYYKVTCGFFGFVLRHIMSCQGSDTKLDKCLAKNTRFIIHTI